MLSLDKGAIGQKAKNQLPRSSPLRRRLTSRLQPLHGGLGFGAKAIKERALLVARQASLRPGATSFEIDGEVLERFEGQEAQFTDEITVVREQPRNISHSKELGSGVHRNRQVTAQQSNKRSFFAPGQPRSKRNPAPVVIVSKTPVPSIKSFITSTRRIPTPSMLQGLAAWFFDALVIVACMVIGFTISATVPFISLLAQKIPLFSRNFVNDSILSGVASWLLLLFQSLALGSLILFAVQAFAGFFLAASVGRAIANVRLAHARSPLVRAFKIGLGEVLQWPIALGLLNAIVSPEHNFLLRSLKWARAGKED